MKCLVITHEGFENICVNEIKELIGSDSEIAGKGKIITECKTEQDFANLCYHGQTFLQVLYLIKSGNCNKMPEPVLDELPYLNSPAIVLCERTGNHDFTSADVELLWNSKLKEKTQVTYKSPKTTYKVIIEDNKIFFCVDISGIDLGRRDYRIFLGSDSLKGTVGALLLYFAEYEPKHTLVDPFCRQGIIPIEAALISTKKSPHKFGKEKFAFTKFFKKYELKEKEIESSGRICALDENFKHISSAKKNAKIAGVSKEVEFGKANFEFMDAKFGKQGVDRIVTFPVQLKKTLPEKAVEKIYRQFWYQVEFVLKKNGKVCVCLRSGLELFTKKAKEFGFEIKKQIQFMQGKERFDAVVFERI